MGIENERERTSSMLDCKLKMEMKSKMKKMIPSSPGVFYYIPENRPRKRLIVAVLL